MGKWAKGRSGEMIRPQNKIILLSEKSSSQFVSLEISQLEFKKTGQ